MWLEQRASTISSEHMSETSSIRGSILESDSDRNMGYVYNFVVSTTGVVGYFTVHGEPIGVMSARAETAPNENTMVQAALHVCGIVQTCVAQCYHILIQAMPSTTGYTGVAA